MPPDWVVYTAAAVAVASAGVLVWIACRAINRAAEDAIARSFGWRPEEVRDAS